MQASMGQAATSLSAGLLDILGDNTDGDMEDNLEALLFCARQELTEAVKIGSDCIPATRKLLQIKCSVALKYAALSVRQILQDNKESAKQLKTIPQALSILEKYGRHLLKPKEQRANLWREIKFNNPIFRDRVLPMKGSLDIVQQMGYTQKTDDGLQFGYDEPDPGTTENLVADIVLARLEMESYLTGSHPHPEVIHCWLPQSTINQLLTLWDQLGGEESGTFTINRSAAITTNMFLPPTPVPVNEKEKNVLVTPDQQVTKIPPTFVSGDVMLSNSFHQQRDSSIRKACDICGETEVALWCQLCDSKQLCDKCDDMWHRHPKRQNHQRKPIACFPSPTSTDLPGANIMGPFGIRAAHSIRENFPIPVSNAHLPTPAVIPKQPALDSSLQQHLQQLHHYQQLQEQQHKQIQNYSNEYSSDKFYHSCNNFPAPTTGQQRWTQSSEYVQTTPSVLNNLPQPADIFNRKDALPFVQRMQSGTGQDKKFNSGFYQLRNVPVSTEMPGLPYHQMIEEKHLPLVTSTIASTPVLESGWNTMRFDQQSMSSIFKLATSQQSGLLSRIVAESDFEKRIVKCDIHTLALKEELDLIAKELDDLLMHYDDVCEHEKFRSLTCRKATLLREYQSLSNYKHELQALMDAGSQSTLISKETNHPSEVFNPPFLASPLLPALNPLQQQTSLYHPQQVSAASHLQHTKSVHQPISVQLSNQQGSPNHMHVTPSLFNGQNNIGLLEEESQKVHFKMMSPIPTVESTELAVSTEFKVPSVSLCTEMPTTAISSSLLSHSIKKPFTVAETVLETRLRDTHLSSSNTLFQPEVSIASALPSNMENTVCARPLDSVHSKLTDLSESHLEKISQKKTRALTSGSPPISASTKFELPQNDWQCEHCTFINTAGTRVCIICHRTSDSPVLLPLKERLTNSGQLNQSVQSFHQSPDKARIPSDSQVASGGRDVHLGNIVRKIVEDQDQVYLEKKEAQKKYILFQEKAQTVEQQGQLCRAQHNIALLTGQIESCTITHNQEVSPLSSNPKQSEHISPKDTLSAKRPSQVSVNIKETGNGGGDNLPVLDSSSIQGSELSSISSLGEFHEKMERLQEQKRQKQQDLDGADLLYFIKMADRQGYGLKEMEIALFHCQGKSQEALSWLQTNWSKMVEVIISSTTSEGQRCQHNDVGELSQKEAIEALKECAGELGPAVKKCVSRRKELYKVLNPSGTYAREEVLLAMLQGQGQEEAAREKLNKTVLQPFFDRIWEGIDQEGSRNGIVTGGRLLQQAASDTCLSVSTSVISHEDFQQAVLDKNIDKERRIRMVLVEGKLRSWGRAELVIKLLDQDLPEAYSRIAGSSQEDADYCLDDVIEAVRNCRDRRSALVYLMQECQICLAHYPMSKIRNLNFCQCKICSDCLKQNFEVVIREKHVRHWTCPLCGLPDLNNADTASEYFTFLGMLLQMQVDREVVTLFEIKMRDWSLQKDPNFRWCAHCGNGFIADRGQLRMVCPHCSQKTCYNCKRQWEDQHEGLTCEQYEQWKIDNDPSNQAVGLARHLEENGIDCPSCKMRYALAKGGCMHFKCPQCGHEFCSGCSEPFYHRGTCSRFKNCKTNGLHAHHPRDCFFYLRDYEVAQLQSLLKGAKVDFNTVTPQSQDDATHCPVIEQKEFDSGKRDESCGKETQEGHAGLCVQHYKEYLVSLINKKHVDPVCAMNVEELIKLIKRGEISAPKQNHNETPSAYRMRLIKLIKEKLPLPQRGT